MGNILTYLAPILAVAFALSCYFLLIQYRETQVTRQINAIKKALSFGLVSGDHHIDLGAIPRPVLKSDRFRELIEYILNYPNLPEGFEVLDVQSDSVKKKLQTNQSLTWQYHDAVFPGVKRATRQAVKSLFTNKKMLTTVSDGQLTVLHCYDALALDHVLGLQIKATVPVVTVSLTMARLGDVDWNPILDDHRISFTEATMIVRYAEMSRLQVTQPEVVSKFYMPAITETALRAVDVLTAKSGTNNVTVSCFRVESPSLQKNTPFKREMCIRLNQDEDTVLILDDLAYFYDLNDFSDVREDALISLVHEHKEKHHNPDPNDTSNEYTLHLGNHQITMFYSRE